MNQITINPKQLATPLATLAIVGVGIYFFVLKNLSNNPNTQAVDNSSTTSAPNIPTNPPTTSDFLGISGTTVQTTSNQILIPESQVEDGQIHYFNYLSPATGKTVYFFIIKATDGTYRAAANACEVCYGAKKGFTQIGNLIRCENCQVTYSKDQIALEKGGCNPGPISPNVPVENNQLVLNISDIEAVAYLF
jgi:uncharacterized membrane protein